MPKNHPLVDQLNHGELRWDQLAEHNVVGLTDDTATAPFLSNIPSFNQPIGTSRYEVSTYHTLRLLVANGLAVATIPALAAKGSEEEGVLFAPMQKPEAWRTVHKITRLGSSLPPIVAAITSDIEQLVVEASKQTSLIELVTPPA